MCDTSLRVRTMIGKNFVRAAVWFTVFALVFGSRIIDQWVATEKMRIMQAAITDTQRNAAAAIIEAIKTQHSLIRYNCVRRNIAEKIIVIVVTGE
jgi:hypothetical protein